MENNNQVNRVKSTVDWILVNLRSLMDDTNRAEDRVQKELQSIAIRKESYTEDYKNSLILKLEKYSKLGLDIKEIENKVNKIATRLDGIDQQDSELDTIEDESVMLINDSILVQYDYENIK